MRAARALLHAPREPSSSAFEGADTTMTLRSTAHRRITAVRGLARTGLEASAALGGAALDVFFRSIRASCRFSLEGHERRARLGACIEVLWHRDALAYCALLPRDVPLVALLDPSLHTASWDVFARRNGWEPVLGSSGHGGGPAASEVVDAVRCGASTFLAVDGPLGPGQRMNRGALRIAARSRRPLVPLRFEYSHAIELPTWDKRRLPLPGSSMTISFLEPLDVDDENDDEAAALLEHALG